MAMDEISKFIDRFVGFFHRFSEPAEHLFGFIIENLQQDIVLILEVEVDRSIGDPCFFGNLRYGCLMKAEIGKYLYGGFENTLVFVVFVSSADGSPPVHIEKVNECSFILLRSLWHVKQKWFPGRQPGICESGYVGIR